MTLNIQDLDPNLPFGARVTGIDPDNIAHEDVRATIRDTFARRGMMVFADVESSARMQVALSEVFGPLEGHALKDVPKADDATPGLVDFEYGDIFEVNGAQLSAYVPWHFDACYAKELNRGGVLRALTIPPEGGLTGFADGIQLYNDMAPALRDRFENLNIIYHSHLMFMNMRFGRPASYNPVRVRQMITDMLDATADAPRSIHPAIWQRDTGERVIHVSPWQAAGIEGMETPEGDALLEEFCQEIYRTMKPYSHPWRPNDMVIWDNWRFVHSVGGHDPQHPRRMQRTTIKGDYGLGRFEHAHTTAAVGMSM